MSRSIYSFLEWLPKPPGDFSERCLSVSASTKDLGAQISELASYRLDENQLHRLARVVRKAMKCGASLAPLVPFRLGLLSNSTLDFVEPVLVASAARRGIALECIRGDYGQVVQDALNPESAILRASPDAVLIALDLHAYPLHISPGDSCSSQESIEGWPAYLDTIRAGIHRHTNAICVLQTLAPPAETLFGSLDSVVPGTLRNLIQSINGKIAERVRESRDVLLDVAGLAETVGLAEWHSPSQWNLAKLPFSSSYLPLYGDHVARVVAALRGKSRRCLILDLDNTIWGGVIGDDGLEGIQISQGDPTGEAFLSVQQMALDLRRRGVVLAVSSKNDDQAARVPFQKHLEMLLREEHIAVFQANWDDKASNIRAIAKELSLGLESMVFLDDNPAERGLVRKLLPEVAIPELPEDPALYSRMLAAAGYFESVILSDEDLKRASFYQDNARRVALQQQFGDVDAYLESLNMEITFQPFDETGRARIAQLINKSNQFNLTTRRYTETDVDAFALDASCLTLQVRLSDTFGDNGMISVVICRQAAEELIVDTWLMSCRVLGRRVEIMVLQEILANAKRRGARRLIGKYIPTGKNGLVEDHYAKLGFSRLATEPDGATVWELDVESAVVQAAPMVVRRHGFDLVEAAVESP
jgi:FkbH-like protein